MNSGANQGDGPQREGFFRPLTRMEKVVVFVSLLILFWLLGGFDVEQLRRRHAITFVVGAVLAVWVRPEPVGLLQPVRFDAFPILLGSLMMVWVVAILLLTRDVRRTPTRDPQSDGPSGAKTTVAAGEVRSANETHGRGVRRGQPRSG